MVFTSSRDTPVQLPFLPFPRCLFQRSKRQKWKTAHRFEIHHFYGHQQQKPTLEIKNSAAKPTKQSTSGDEHSGGSLSYVITTLYRRHLLLRDLYYL